ncbi:hypothetical protein WISP_41353 [Willisornis vidua]|uniref:Uncharacterized protein n=1 Tax=Willisornis vidua TaxID=1566151 RepID=A0ABQ9DMI9_9PASS|nr:hypothetical protein WISP_41353 [Willisornis vidua]
MPRQLLLVSRAEEATEKSHSEDKPQGNVRTRSCGQAELGVNVAFGHPRAEGASEEERTPERMRQLTEEKQGVEATDVEFTKILKMVQV